MRFIIEARNNRVEQPHLHHMGKGAAIRRPRKDDPPWDAGLLWARITALLLLLALAAGCTGDSTLLDAGARTVSMGRYVESEIALPRDVGFIPFFGRDREGELLMLAGDGVDRYSAANWVLLRSGDEGVTWREEQPDWLDQVNGNMVLGATLDAQGRLYLCLPPEAEEGETEYQESMAYRVLGIEPDGGVHRTVVESYPAKLDVDGDGNIVVSGMYEVECYTSEGALIETYTGPTPRITLDAIKAAGDTLAIRAGSKVRYVDLATGAEQAVVDLPEKEKAEEWPPVFAFPTDTIQYDGAGQSWYICTASGIYRHARGGSLVELVVDGSMFSLSMPSVHNEILVVLEDAFLVLSAIDGGGYTLLRYDWRDDLPTLPDRELRVFSLKESKVAQQTAGLFQREHPQVHVALETGEGVAYADALQTLNTQILAGKGPDILVLDGLPVQAYIDKGALADIRAALPVDDLFPNLLEIPGNTGEASFAIPAQFSVPLLIGGDEAVDAITDYSSLVDWIVRRAGEDPDNDQMLTGDPLVLFELLYPVCAPGWYTEDGTLDRDKLSAFLSGIATLSDAAPGQAFPGFGFPHDCLYWAYGRRALGFGEMKELYEVRAPYAAIALKGEGRLVPLPGQVDNVFIPHEILGIAATSDQQEMAAEFLQLALSVRVQDYSFREGFPVNRVSFARQLSALTPGSDAGGYTGADKDGEGIAFITPWPSLAEQEEFMVMMGGLDTPFMEDTGMGLIVSEQAEAYFSGKNTLEEAVDAAAAKLELYRAES